MTGDRLPHSRAGFLNVSGRWFRLLLRLYPADFRDEMGEALVETYQDRAREAFKDGGVFRLAGVWLGALRDSLRNGMGERARPAISWRRSGDWGRDLGLVSRRLWRTPLLIVAILGTLTIGLGTFAVIYTAADKILLEALPYQDPEDLYMVWRKSEKFVITGPEAAELRKAGGLIEGVAILRWAGLTLPAGEHTDASRMMAMSASPELFEVLRVRPAIGRGFSPDETGPHSPNVMVLSDRLWRHLGGDRAIVGTQIKISAQPFTIIGIMPPDFQFSASETQTVDAYIPLYDDLPSQPPLSGDWTAVIRARHGSAPQLVQEAVDEVSRFVDERVNQGKLRGLQTVGLHADLVAQVRPALLALSFAAVFLVLVLTVNLASLLLARAAEREKEFAVSRALGASGPAVVRAMLIERGLLGLAGGVSGALAGMWGTRLLVALGPMDLPRRETILLDSGVAAVVISVGVVLGLAAAAVPALWAARVSLPALLAASAVRGGASSGRMRRSLIVVQVALSLVLLSAGGLVVRSFERLLGADPGFRPQGVLTLGVGLGTWLFPENADSFAFQDRVAAALRALPGVTHVSATTTLPLSRGGSVSWISGDPDRKGMAGYRIFARAGYVETMGMRLVAGRAFAEARPDGVHEALIDRPMAGHFFPQRSPLGATLLWDSNRVTIVGVVEQARLHDLHQDDDRPQIFLRAEDYSNRPGLFALRTNRDPHALIREVQTIVRQIDRRVPVFDVRTMDEIVAERRSRERISAVLIAGLALGALLLVSMGLFGVIAGSVARRRGELAVRIALGATHQRVIRLVVGEGARLIAAGLLIGIPGIYMSGEAIRGLLIEVSPFDGPTLAGVAAGLVAVALLACYLAARRVTAIEPERLLRDGG